MSNPRNRRIVPSVAAALGFVFAAGCDAHTPLQNGLNSFQVTAEDLSGMVGQFPTDPVEISVTAKAVDELGNFDNSFNGKAYVYVTPGQVMAGNTVATSPDQEPQIQFTNGKASGTLWAQHPFGDTVVWVESRPVGGADAGAALGNYATGVSDPPIHYGYPLLSDLQITSDNTKSPLMGNYVNVDQSKTRCIAPQSDGGCDPSQVYSMDLIVTAVQSDGFYVMDRNSYDPTSGKPMPGFDPDTFKDDLPGSWAYLFVYNYDAPDLFVGDRLVALSGNLGEFVGDTQMDFPAWTKNPDPQYADPHPQDVPPPVAIDPAWCAIGTPGDHLADQYLCAPGTDNLQLESLESGLVVAHDVTLPSRFLNCDLTGTGKVPYRKASGCLPQTSGSFCGEIGAAIAHCPEGSDCVANECARRCESSSDCSALDQEACIDGHCQNACLCREYCDSLLGCTEQSEFAGYGQYAASFPGQNLSNGGQHPPWKLSFETRSGVPGLVPQAKPGMVVDVVGMLVQVRASDPMWEIAPRVASDVCCHGDSPGCDATAGVAICPQPTAQ